MGTTSITSPTDLDATSTVSETKGLSGNPPIASQSRSLMLAIVAAVALAGSAHAEDTKKSPQLVASVGNTPYQSSPSPSSSTVTSISALIPPEWIKEFQDPKLKPDTVEDWPKEKRKAFTTWKKETGKSLDAANQALDTEIERKLAANQVIQQTGKSLDAANQALDTEIERKLAANQKLLIQESAILVEHFRLVVSKYTLSGKISPEDKTLLLELLQRTDPTYAKIQAEIRKSIIYPIITRA